MLVVYEAPPICVVKEGTAALVIWREGVRVEHIHAMNDGLDQAARGTMVWLPDGGTRVDDDVKRALAEVMSGSRDAHDPPPPLEGLVYVLDKPGFSAAVARTIITALNLLTRPSYPVKVVATLEDAFTWFVELRVVRGTPAQLANDLREVDAEHRARMAERARTEPVE
ncbi:MAG: hypothetical protein KC619_04070 [Myxococcales bacterium]|nr:hypothetical protein [Myxococcales bacterium]